MKIFRPVIHQDGDKSNLGVNTLLQLNPEIFILSLIISLILHALYYVCTNLFFVYFYIYLVWVCGSLFLYHFYLSFSISFLLLPFISYLNCIFHLFLLSKVFYLSISFIFQCLISTFIVYLSMSYIFLYLLSFYIFYL